jgi:tRNA A37 threonylcarbamoyladenosine synthetase subunit TsaC/SUA5/YrdC
MQRRDKSLFPLEIDPRFSDHPVRGQVTTLTELPRLRRMCSHLHTHALCNMRDKHLLSPTDNNSNDLDSVGTVSEIRPNILEKVCMS